MYQLSLHDGWLFKPATSHDPQATQLDWMPATVPGTVQQDLLAAGLIPDPYLAKQELDIQWIGAEDWEYRCTFAVPEELLAEPCVDLVCDGLDTVATVWINGHEVYSSTNMFVPLRAAVKTWLHPRDNEMRILFSSPWHAGKAREEENGVLTHWNGDASRLYLRKAQYHYGWDWGPTILTVGPWLPIRLEAYQARIVDLHVPTVVEADLLSASLALSVTLAGSLTAAETRVETTVYDPQGTVLSQTVLPVREQGVQQTITIGAPQLWWPNGYGEQPLYRVVTTVWQGDRQLDVREKRVGLRRLELVRRPLTDVEGESFFFRVNNTPLFCGGANWIPADLMLPRVTKELYQDWLKLAVAANMVMLRVWGGGIYEVDAFYDLCDEMGLLVWQDFMFACGLYPADETMLTSLRAEVEAQVVRLRDHASIALWAGNNEDYWISYLTGHYTPAVAPQADTQFPARVIYEELLPEICARIDPTRPYWPGSPYAGDDPNSGIQGDRHAWEIWNSPVDRYQNYANWRGRFVSEFGMIATPSVEAINAFMPESEHYPESPALAWHNKAEHYETRMNAYFEYMGRMPQDLHEFVYLSQLVQSEALSWALRGWRRYWRGEGREEVSGALVWQLNDCWPAISWALADNKLQVKPGYYELKRALAPFALGAMRAPEGSTAQVWVMNSHEAQEQAQIVIQRWTLAGELRETTCWQGTLPANRAIELPEQPLASDEVLALRLEIAGNVQARFVLWPEQQAQWPDPELQITALDADTIQITSKRPARAIWLEAGSQHNWSDNQLDILPDEPRTITAPGLAGQQVTARSFR